MYPNRNWTDEWGGRVGSKSFRKNHTIQINTNKASRGRANHEDIAKEVHLYLNLCVDESPSLGMICFYPRRLKYPL